MRVRVRDNESDRGRFGERAGTCRMTNEFRMIEGPKPTFEPFSALGLFHYWTFVIGNLPQSVLVRMTLGIAC